tara:strand:+ start:2935 stop:4350 length:1416 start_codon:yes stop_codon:yes gene_type:complete
MDNSNEGSCNNIISNSNCEELYNITNNCEIKPNKLKIDKINKCNIDKLVEKYINDPAETEDYQNIIDSIKNLEKRDPFEVVNPNLVIKNKLVDQSADETWKYVCDLNETKKDEIKTEKCTEGSLKEDQCTVDKNPDYYFEDNQCKLKNNASEKLSGDNDTDYRGLQNKTILGKDCLKWSDQPLSGGDRNDKVQKALENKTHGVAKHNYCRNPDGGNTIWCYTTDPTKRWDFCLTKEVEQCSKSNGKLAIDNTCVDSMYTYKKIDQHIGCHNNTNLGILKNYDRTDKRPKHILSTVNTNCTDESKCIDIAKAACQKHNQSLSQDHPDRCIGFAFYKGWGVQLYNKKALNNDLCDGKYGLMPNTSWNTYIENNHLPQQYNKNIGKDSLGNDICIGDNECGVDGSVKPVYIDTSLPYNTRSKENKQQCIDLCNNVRNCELFTYNETNNKCYLKHTVNNTLSNNSNAVTYIKSYE